MQALIYTAPLEMTWAETAKPRPKPGEVLVRVQAVGICGSDMHAYHGHDDRRPPPLVLGHEAAGVIEGGARDGERVTINPLVTDPDCPVVKAGRPHLSPTRQIISMPQRPGAFAEYVTIPERNVLPVPDELDMRHAALAEPIAVSWHAVRIGFEHLRESPPNVRVLVLGGGAIGIAAAIIARHLGAASVRIAETHPGRRAMLQSEPGIAVFDPSDQSADTGDDSADLVIDAVGAEATRVLASKTVRPGGVIVHVGLLPGAAGFDLRRITLQEITVTGSYCYTPEDFSAALAAIADGSLGSLGWTESRPMAEGALAFADLHAGRVAAPKIILTL